MYSLSDKLANHAPILCMKPESSKLAFLGDVMWLMAHSKLHKSWPIPGIFQWVMPAYAHRQFRLYRRHGRPIAYVAWAHMTKKVEEAYVLNPRCLDPNDWVGGDRRWIVDWIAPFGDSAYVMKDLREGIFKNEVGRALRIKPGSDEVNIIYIHGAEAAGRAHGKILNPAIDLTSESERGDEIRSKRIIGQEA